MSSSVEAAAADRAAGRVRRSSLVPALLLGVPLAAAILGVIYYGPLRESVAYRYVSHSVEGVEVLMFCCALGALAAKLFHLLRERRALGADALPPWDGHAVPTTEAGRLLAGLNSLPARVHDTLLVRRAHAVLDFLCRRGSANELDDHLRDLADGDAVALEGSYGLIRFITWAIPILGFLGTVLGITGAISGVTPEKLENDLNQVTDGLALAFDATALALGLTMLTMFLTFVVERAEQSVLEAVDRYTDRQLAHRFERTGAEAGPFVEVVRQNSQVVLAAAEKLVQQQTDLWAKALEETDRRRTEAEQRQQERLTAALEEALQRTLHAHGQQVASLEKEALERSTGYLERLSSLTGAVQETGDTQRLALVQVAESVNAQAAALARLQEGEKHLLHLQEALQQNLAALAGAGSFEQAVHSLTAAIHLLTARAAPAPTGPRPGKAA